MREREEGRIREEGVGEGRGDKKFERKREKRILLCASKREKGDKGVERGGGKEQAGRGIYHTSPRVHHLQYENKTHYGMKLENARIL